MNELKSNRLHIGIFGKTNTGKSSLINAILNQEISITSPVPGTTTDVVEKSAELFPVGAVTFLDTAGLDDKTELGDKRVEKTLKTLNRTDVAVIVCDYNGFSDLDKELIVRLKELKIPYFIIINKMDTANIAEDKLTDIKCITENVLKFSTIKDKNLTDKFVETLLKVLPEDFINNSSRVFGPLLSTGYWKTEEAISQLFVLFINVVIDI